jgi:hypothetical protein
VKLLFLFNEREEIEMRIFAVACVYYRLLPDRAQYGVLLRIAKARDIANAKEDARKLFEKEYPTSDGWQLNLVALEVKLDEL